MLIFISWPEFILFSKSKKTYFLGTEGQLYCMLAKAEPAYKGLNLLIFISVLRLLFWVQGYVYVKIGYTQCVCPFLSYKERGGARGVVWFVSNIYRPYFPNLLWYTPDTWFFVYKVFEVIVSFLSVTRRITASPSPVCSS